MSLTAVLKKRLNAFDIDLSFTCKPGNISVMIGPSGGGKTTIIRMLAGLEKPDKGKIVSGDDVWFDSDTGTFIQPQKRRPGYVFQDYTLFPHLNLFENAAFAAVERKDVYELLDVFQIAHLAKRKPHMVSGGERQRCAICQALARRPGVLLMDEPFSALDFITRRTLREEMKSLKNKLAIPVIYVTHDINEALFLADEMLPVVVGKIDRSWVNQPLSEGDRDRQLNRAAREVKLSLAY
jgi:molybdate transport system ATP-binding protein